MLITLKTVRLNQGSLYIVYINIYIYISTNLNLDELIGKIILTHFFVIKSDFYVVILH